MQAAEVIEAHRAAGETFEAMGVRSFVRRQGAGEPVLLMHGVPSSSFLYRKVLAEVAALGLEGVAFDLPGLGLAGRPEDFDYTWTGLGRFCVAAVDALDLDRFHLVVHDIGGPVGFELAAVMPERICSLTITNTLIEVDTFRRPWSMEPFAWPGLDRIWLASMTSLVFRQLMYLHGVKDRGCMSDAELAAYPTLLKREDGGRAFLKIMKGFERTKEKTALYTSTVQEVPYPVQVVWGRDDPAIKLANEGQRAKELTGVDRINELPGKHFFQEEQPQALAELIAVITTGLPPG